jgi:HAD superfamily hydrolase (TIGR01662 family)
MKKFFVKGIFFDLWNTLAIGSRDLEFEVEWINFLNLNVSKKEFIRAWEETSMTEKISGPREMFTRLMKHFKIPISREKIDFLVKHFNESAARFSLYDDAVKVLKHFKAKGAKLALISNCMSFEERVFSGTKNIEHFFDVLVYSYEVGAVKPSKIMFETALKKINLPKEKIVMVGDSLSSDIRPAKSLGLKTILIDRQGNYLNPVEPDAVIKNLKELINLIEVV